MIRICWQERPSSLRTGSLRGVLLKIIQGRFLATSIAFDGRNALDRFGLDFNEDAAFNNVLNVDNDVIANNESLAFAAYDI